MLQLFKNTILMTAVRQSWNRLCAKSPKYHTYLSYVAAACGIIIGMPEVLQSVNIHVPDVLGSQMTKIISVASFVAAFVAQLSVENPDDIKPKN